MRWVCLRKILKNIWASPTDLLAQWCGGQVTSFNSQGHKKPSCMPSMFCDALCGRYQLRCKRLDYPEMSHLRGPVGPSGHSPGLAPPSSHPHQATRHVREASVVLPGQPVQQSISLSHHVRRWSITQPSPARNLTHEITSYNEIAIGWRHYIVKHFALEG